MKNCKFRGNLLESKIFNLDQNEGIWKNDNRFGVVIQFISKEKAKFIQITIPSISPTGEECAFNLKIQ